MKKSNLEKRFLEVLEQTTNISLACKKVDLSRNTIYRWMEEDEEFAKKMHKAMKLGEEFIWDLTDSQIITAVKNGEWKAIKYLADRRHPKYKKQVQRDKSDPEQEQGLAQIVFEIVNHPKKGTKEYEEWIKKYPPCLDDSCLDD